MHIDKTKFMTSLKFYLEGVLPQKYHSLIQRQLIDEDKSEDYDDALLQLWNSIPTNSPAEVERQLSEIYSKAKKAKTASRKPHTRTLFIKYAATVVFIISATIGTWKLLDSNAENLPHMAEVRVPFGQTMEVKMFDGTNIMLNAGTTLKYPTESCSGSRDVYLDGEAIFDVEHDEVHPFKVHVGSVCIEDLGTIFNVRTYDKKQITTTLAEGSVKMYEGKDLSAVELKPGEQATYNLNTHKFRIEAVNVDKAMAWTDGALVFDDVTLIEIFREVERKYGVTINHQLTPKQQNQRYTVEFSESESISDVMAYLSRLCNLTYSPTKK